jgi:hypothetical protein
MLVLAGLARAQQANSLANQKFELKDKVTAASAKEAYNQTLFRLTRLSNTEKEQSCVLLQEKHPCFRRGNGISIVNYLPPFPLELPFWRRFTELDWRRRYGHDFRDRRMHSWAPAEEVFKGTETVADWKSLAAAGAIFNCEGPVCLTIVNALSGGKVTEVGEHTLAICQISTMPRVFVARVSQATRMARGSVPVASASA